MRGGSMPAWLAYSPIIHGASLIGMTMNTTVALMPKGGWH
jgi:hypothetical protein